MNSVAGRSPSMPCKFVRIFTNFFAGRKLDCCFAKIMRRAHHPMELTHEQVRWRLKHGRSLSGYIIRNFDFNEFRPRLEEDDRLRLDHTELIDCNLGKVEAYGTVKGARVTNLDLSESKLGLCCSDHRGWDMRGLSGTVLLKDADPTEWRLSKDSRSISFSEVKKASDDFKGENKNKPVDVDPLLDVALYSYALTDVRYPSDNAKAVAHHIVNQITSECSEHDIKTDLQRGAWLFFKDKIKNFENKPKDLQTMTERMEFEGIFALYEHAKEEPECVLYDPTKKWQMYNAGGKQFPTAEEKWRMHRPAQQEIKRFVYEKVCHEFLKEEPNLSYFQKMIQEMEKMERPDELSNFAEYFYHHYKDAQKKGYAPSEKQEICLRELESLCAKYVF
ncbi:MAG: hypothetical protein C5B47_00070 [Verrucomicrobia bacterium]|nr:MAG: hypothetical protein C5B47_00070 [Verrucomicrobiota bacterium]